MHDFPEQDWRVFREVAKTALDRFFLGILSETARLAMDQSVPPGDRYRRLYKFLQNRDREIASAFDNARRSRALTQLIQLRGMQLITDVRIRAILGRHA